MADQVLLTGGTIVDGSGTPPFAGEVLIRADRIAAVAPSGLPRDGADVVDVHGSVITPGFIDVLSHSITPVLRDPRSLSKVAMGVTTEIVGEAWTPAPVRGHVTAAFEEKHQHVLGATYDEWERKGCTWERFGDWGATVADAGLGVNMGAYIGGGTVREVVKGLDPSPASADDIAMMRDVVDQAMADGAFGIGTALIYPPGAFTTTDELVVLAEVIAGYDGVYATHMRSEGDRFLEAVDEAIEIGRRSGAKVEIFHLKAAGQRNWHKMSAAIERIEAARAEGLRVACDVYPYTAAGTGLSASLPPWAAALAYEQLQDPSVRQRVRDEVAADDDEWENLGVLAGPDGVLLTKLSSPEFARYSGQTVAQIAADRDQHWLDCAMDLIATERSRVDAIYFLMDEGGLRQALAQPWSSVSTDASGWDPAWAAAQGLRHPRAYGSYARVLGRYVRDQALLSLEQAVHKMSAVPAHHLGITGRGRLVEGAFADVLVFDPDTITDHATFTDPHQLATGIQHVWVNGGQVIRDGVHTGALPGRWLSR